jgi:hypothetical protein
MDLAIMEKTWRHDIPKGEVRLIDPALEVVVPAVTTLGLIEEPNTAKGPIVTAGELVTVWGLGWCSTNNTRRSRRIKLVVTAVGQFGWLFHEECDPIKEVSDGS